MVGYSTDSGNIAFFLLLYFGLLLFTSYFGQWCVLTLPNLQISLFCIMAFLLLLNCITGFIIPNKDLLKIFQVINYVNPITYFFNAIMSSQMWCSKEPCTLIDVIGLAYPLPINTYVENIMDLHYAKRWYYALGILIFLLLTRFATYISLTFIRYMA